MVSTPNSTASTLAYLYLNLEHSATISPKPNGPTVLILTLTEPLALIGQRPCATMSTLAKELGIMVNNPLFSDVTFIVEGE